MDKMGMGYRFTLDPFTIAGTVGNDACLRITISGGIEIKGRDDIYRLAEKLERLGDEVSKLHGYEGRWGFPTDPLLEDWLETEADGDGVPMQDLA